MPLTLVPKAEPSPKQAVLERVKRLPRPSGMLQCPHCGSRTIMTSRNGVIVKNGKKGRGTLIHEDVCADCYKKGDIVYVAAKIERVT